MDGHPPALATEAVAELLRATPALLRAAVAALPGEAAGWHAARGEWCVNEVVGHLIEAEAHGFADRIRLLLGAEEPLLPVWDQEEIAHGRRDCRRATSDLLDEFDALREASAAFVVGLGEADLGRGGHHPDIGYLRVRDLLHEWAYHDWDHTRQLLASLQAYVRPHMGNTRRFYEL